MENRRRAFLKKLSGLAVYTSLCSPVKVLADTIEAPESGQGVDIDEHLHFLNREVFRYPDNETEFYSSYHRVSIEFKSIDEPRNTAVLLIQGAEKQFSLRQEPDRMVLESVDGRFLFFWKPGFGLYALDPKEESRILELCHPLSVPYKSDCDVNPAPDAKDKFYSDWVRSTLWSQGIAKSPLPGLAGFTEEMLQCDSSEKRYVFIARGLRRFINSLPFGLEALKVLAKVSPSKAATVVELLIPKVFGWMMGPVQNPEPGKLVLLDCPYRKRLGTFPCETTCGHDMARFFTEEVGIPMKFDPTVDNYQKCHVLIGKKQCT